LIFILQLSKTVALVSYLGLYGNKPDIQSVHTQSALLHLATT